LFFRVEQRSPTIYLGGGQDFLSEIGLFRKLPGTELFASRVKSGSSIELGENVQLRSIVRSGDGKIIFLLFFLQFILHENWGINLCLESQIVRCNLDLFPG
jgi:hypothetical protein